jgi:hypothetical protein
MKPKQFRITFVCALLLAAMTGCQKQQAVAPPPPQSVDKSSQNSITNPSSPVYGWGKYTSAEGKFSAIFPKRPGEEQKTAQEQDGEVQSHLFASETGAHVVYSVAYFDLPHGKDPKLLVISIEQSIVAHQNGKLVSYRLFQVESNPATEFEFVGGSPTNFSGNVRLISVGQRIYAFDALFLTGHSPNPDECDAFFNSFSLLQN